MAKSGGSTRTSSSSAPKGLRAPGARRSSSSSSEVNGKSFSIENSPSKRWAVAQEATALKSSMQTYLNTYANDNGLSVSNNTISVNGGTVTVSERMAGLDLKYAASKNGTTTYHAKLKDAIKALK